MSGAGAVSTQSAAPKYQFSHSRLSLFLTCPQKYFMEYVLGVGPVGRQLAYEFGQAMHRAREVLQEGWDVKAAAEAFEAAFEDDPSDTKRTRATARLMLERYKNAYENQPFKYIHKGFRFVLRVPELDSVGGVALRGEIDGVVDWHGRLMVDELKTTSQLTADYMKRFWVDYQTTIYLIAARGLINPKISAVLADAVLVAKSDPSKLRSAPLLRDILERTPEQLEYFRGRVVQLLGQMVACHEAWESGENDLWWENPKSCTEYGGCRFLTYCREAPSVRQRIREMDFKKLRGTESEEELNLKYEDCLKGEF